MLTFFADVHLANHRAFGGPVKAGLNDRAHEALRALRLAREAWLAEAGGLGAFVGLGDLFDGTTPLPQIISAAADVLPKANTTLLVGNHEQVSTEHGDHALGPLGHLVNAVVDRPYTTQLGGAAIGFVPFRPGKAAETLPADVAALWGKQKAGERRVLGMHYGICGKDAKPHQREMPDAVPIQQVLDLAERHGVSAVFSGHWHEHATFAGAFVETGEVVHVVQVGALVPTGWDNPGLRGYGMIAHYDPMRNTIKVQEVPGPRFVKWTWPPCAVDAFPEPGENRVYLRVTAPPAFLGQATEWVAQLTQAGRVAGGEALPDDEAMQEAAVKAAVAARSEDTMAEALAAFVGEMPLDAGVDRMRVLEIARKYLGGGAA